MTARPPLLVLDGVAAGYSAPVVGPVSLALQPGEIIGLSGPNGCGKSTLVDSVLGRARVFKGEIRRAEGLRVTVQRQHPIRLPEMPLNGREVLRLTGADKLSIPGSIQPFVNRRLDELSGGQYQLLQVWACLAAPADLVILDEPTSNMDAQSKASLEEILTGPHESVAAVLVISHDWEFLQRVTSRIVRIGE